MCVDTHTHTHCTFASFCFVSTTEEDKKLDIAWNFHTVHWLKTWETVLTFSSLLRAMFSQRRNIWRNIWSNLISFTLVQSAQCLAAALRDLIVKVFCSAAAPCKFIVNFMWAEIAVYSVTGWVAVAASHAGLLPPGSNFRGRNSQAGCWDWQAFPPLAYLNPSQFGQARWAGHGTQ